MSTNPQHYTGGGVITATDADGLHMIGCEHVLVDNLKEKGSDAFSRRKCV